MSRLRDEAANTKGNEMAGPKGHKEGRNPFKRGLSANDFNLVSSQVQEQSESSSHGTMMMQDVNITESGSEKKVRRPLFQNGKDDQPSMEPKDQDDVMAVNEQLSSPAAAINDNPESDEAMDDDDDLLELEEEYKPTEEEIAEAAEELRKAKITAQEEESQPSCGQPSKPALSPTKPTSKPSTPIRGISSKKMMALIAMSPRKGFKAADTKGK